jgi:ankyrin repeat protein
VSPRQPRDIDDDQPLQKILLSLVGDADKAARQATADNRLIAAMQASVVDRSAVEAALKDGACPDRLLPGGVPVLHAAVQRGDADLLRLFIAFDAELSDTDGEGASALDTAYRLHFVQGIRLLSDAGAPFCQIGNDSAYLTDEPSAGNYQTRIDTVLMSAIHNGTADDVRRALSLGADPNAVEHTQGRARYSALHLSIARCDVQKVNVLLDAGADVHAVSGRGETSMDMLWWAGAKDMLGPEWQEIYRTLDARGGRTLFSRRPDELTLDDLRATVPIGLDGKTSVLHFLVRIGKMDLVMSVIGRSPGGLTQEDVMRRSDYYGGETLLEAFAARRQLSQLFTSAVWRERLDEMLSLKPQVDAEPRTRAQVDFDAAARDIRRYQQDALSRRAEEQADLIRLKPRPKNARGGKPPGSRNDA